MSVNTVLGDNMSEKKKTCLSKPPVPARPKNLVVLNSKHLPQPPETFLAENMSKFIKDLNLDVKGEDADQGGSSSSPRRHFENESNSDQDEDTDGYLEPASLPSTNLPATSQRIRKANLHLDLKKTSYEDNPKLGNVFRKVVNRKNSGSSEASGTEETKLQISQRPLPLPPVGAYPEVASMPWFRNVDRQGGVELLENGVDGYFLVRPSSNADTYLVLTLWYKYRIFNIPIRKLTDGMFALGTEKDYEHLFDSVEYMIKYHQSEKLILSTNGVRAGETVLTVYPP